MTRDLVFNPINEAVRSVVLTLDGKNPTQLAVDGNLFDLKPRQKVDQIYLGDAYFQVAEGTWNAKTGIPPTVSWILHYETQLVEQTEGFSFAFVPRSIGTYRLVRTIVDYDIRNGAARESAILVTEIKVVQRSGQTIISPKTDEQFMEAVTNAKVGDRIMVDRKTTFAKPFATRGNIVGTPAGSLTYTGDQTHSPFAITLLQNGSISSVELLNPAGFNQPDRELVANLFRCGGNNYIQDCRGAGWRNVAKLNNSPDRVLISRNKFLEPIDYFVWMQGHCLVIEGNRVENSKREHGIRGYGYSAVSIAKNWIQNLDKRPGDPIDIAKGCVVCQWGQGVYLYANEARGTGGGLGIGPLGRNDGKAKPDDRVRMAVARYNKAVGVKLEFWHGTEGFLAQGNEADIHFENTEVGYPPERTLRNGLVEVLSGRKIDECRGDNVTIIR